MTNAAPLLPFGEPAPRTLPNVHAELSNEMARLNRDAPELYAEATKLFKQNQEARTDVTAAEKLLADVLALTTPANVPFQSPVLQQEPVTLEDAPHSEEPAQDEEDPAEDDADADPEASAEEESESDDAQEGDDGEEDAEPTTEEAPAPESDPAGDVETSSAMTASLDAPLTPDAPVWPEGAVGAGMISQLAATLAPGDMLSLVLTRVGDQLLVTVQPTPLKGEPGSTAQALQVKGMPAALDTQMVGKLDEYRQGREVARATVNYAAQVQAAAEAHRKAVAEAAKKNAKSTVPTKATASKAPQTGNLTIEVAPKDAVLVLQDQSGKTHPIQAARTVSLPAGEYTLSVDAEGYESTTEKISVKPAKSSKTAVVLKKQLAQSLF